ncbi:hypothetical protein LCGC14_2457670, partial [marine sediment metagenome]
TLYGGADLAVDLRRSAINSTQNGTATIAHSGFTDGNDKLIFFIGTDIATEDSAGTGINNSFGVCHATGSDAGGWTFVQRSVSWSSDHNNVAGSPASRMTTSRVLDILTETGGADWQLEVTALDHSPAEWTVTTRQTGAGAGMEVYSLALDIDDRSGKVFSVDGPTSGATWVVTGIGFTPQYVGLVLTAHTLEVDIRTDAQAGAHGISSNTGSGEETCHSWYNEDAALDTVTNNLFRSRVIDFRDDDVTTVIQDHSHLSFDSDGFTTTINAENETTARKFFGWAIEKAAAAGPITLGLASETDAALVLGRLKSLAFTLGAETDSAQGIIPARSALLGTATETDSGFTVPFSKARLVGVAAETDSALALGRLKELLLTLAGEADATFVIPHSKARTPGTAGETDSALALGRLKELLIALAGETDTTFAVSASRAKTLGIAGETDSAFVLTWAKSKGVGVAGENDSTFVLTWTKARGIGIAGETDSALSVLPVRLVPVGVALELDTAFVLAWTKAKL